MNNEMPDEAWLWIEHGTAGRWVYGESYGTTRYIRRDLDIEKRRALIKDIGLWATGTGDTNNLMARLQAYIREGLPE